MNRIWISDQTKRADKLTSDLKSVLRCALKVLKYSHTDLSVVLTSNAQIRKLNREYRNKDQSTDVLAFPQLPTLSDVRTLLGDIIICIPFARRQAKEFHHSLEEEVYALAIHGLLHLAGYDHIQGRDAKQMSLMQEKLRKRCCP